MLIFLLPLKLTIDGKDDLTDEELKKIAEVYQEQFKDVGFSFLSNTLFNQVLVTKDRISI